jgi:hypothetical protein
MITSSQKAKATNSSLALYGNPTRFFALESSDGEMETPMTFRIADMGNEAQLVEIGERLSDALSSEQQPTELLLDIDPNYIDAAKTMLATLSGEVAALPSRAIALTEQQIETFLDFDPDFLEIAKDMLRGFIGKTEVMGVRENTNGY